MPGFFFRLEQEDGTPADPPVLHTRYRTAPGDTIPLSFEKTLRVIETRLVEKDFVLVVEPA
jgi:hypothetical protein